MYSELNDAFSPERGKRFLWFNTFISIRHGCILILTLIVHTCMLLHFFYSSWKLSHSIEQIYCRPVLFESLSFGVLCLWVFQGMFMGLFELFVCFRHTLNVALNDLIICFICHNWYAYIIFFWLFADMEMFSCWRYVLMQRFISLLNISF